MGWWGSEGVPFQLAEMKGKEWIFMFTANTELNTKKRLQIKKESFLNFPRRARTKVKRNPLNQRTKKRKSVAVKRRQQLWHSSWVHRLGQTCWGLPSHASWYLSILTSSGTAPRRAHRMQQTVNHQSGSSATHANTRSWSSGPRKSSNLIFHHLSHDILNKTVKEGSSRSLQPRRKNWWINYPLWSVVGLLWKPKMITVAQQLGEQMVFIDSGVLSVRRNVFLIQGHKVSDSLLASPEKGAHINLTTTKEGLGLRYGVDLLQRLSDTRSSQRELTEQRWSWQRPGVRLESYFPEHLKAACFVFLNMRVVSGSLTYLWAYCPGQLSPFFKKPAWETGQTPGYQPQQTQNEDETRNDVLITSRFSNLRWINKPHGSVHCHRYLFSLFESVLGQSTEK